MNVSQRKGKVDRELDAMAAILGALEDLDGDSIQRVLDYVFGRLSLHRPMPYLVASPSSVDAPQTGSNLPASARQPSIRDLKEEKRPESANQMAALVAYYLSEIVDVGERKETITASDLDKYFRQARFKLPKVISQALPNATAAGYFDSVGSGVYRLNAVGYNLVVHGLPRDEGRNGHVVKRVRKKNNGRR